MKLRNWIEEAIRNQMAWSPVCIGSVGGRKLYSITLANGDEMDCFIDFDNHIVEPY